MALGSIIKAGAALIPGITKGIGALFGGRKRRRRERAARSEFQNQMNQYKNFEFTNTYADIENPLEDLRVSTEAAEFQSQQVQQGLAQSLDALRGAGGGTGAAAIAQAMAQQQARTQQQIAADISKQEVTNERIAAQAELQLGLQKAKGDDLVQQREFGRQSTLLGMSQQELASATEARAKATSALTEGLGTAALGAFGYSALNKAGGGEGLKGILNLAG
jgi:hypothetical protein